AAAAVVFAAIPLLLVAAVSSLRSPLAVKYLDEGVFLPVDGSFRVSATRSGGKELLEWTVPGGAAATFYRVFRSPPLQPDPYTRATPPAREGIQCLAPKVARNVAGGAADCKLVMRVVATANGNQYVDRPPPGRWTYRIGLAANWLNDVSFGDVLLLSTPATVTVGR